MNPKKISAKVIFFLFLIVTSGVCMSMQVQVLDAELSSDLSQYDEKKYFKLNYDGISSSGSESDLSECSDCEIEDIECEKIAQAVDSKQLEPYKRWKDSSFELPKLLKKEGDRLLELSKNGKIFVCSLNGIEYVYSRGDTGSKKALFKYTHKLPVTRLVLNDSGTKLVSIGFGGNEHGDAFLEVKLIDIESKRAVSLANFFAENGLALEGGLVKDTWFEFACFSKDGQKILFALRPEDKAGDLKLFGYDFEKKKTFFKKYIPFISGGRLFKKFKYNEFKDFSFCFISSSKVYIYGERYGENGEFLYEFDKNEGDIYDSFLSKDGKKVVSCTADGQFILYDLEKEEKISLCCSLGRYEFIQRFFFSDTGRYIAFATTTQNVYVCDLSKYSDKGGPKGDFENCLVFKKTYSSEDEAVSSFVLDENKKIFAFGVTDYFVRVYDLQTGGMIVAIDNASEDACGGVNVLKLTKDARYIISGQSDGGTVNVTDIEKKKLLFCSEFCPRDLVLSQDATRFEYPDPVCEKVFSMVLSPQAYFSSDIPHKKKAAKKRFFEQLHKKTKENSFSDILIITPGV